MAATVPACPLDHPDDIPDGVAPEHLAILFEGDRRLAPDVFDPCRFPNFGWTEVRVFPVAEYLSTYNGAGKGLFELKRLLSGGTYTPGAEIPLIPFLDAFPAFTEREATVSFSGGMGTAFLTQWMIEPDTIGERLALVFQALSADGKTYVLATFPVHTRIELPVFPIPRNEAIERTYARYKSYAGRVATAIRAAKNDDFTPDLGALVEMLRSVQLR